MALSLGLPPVAVSDCRVLCCPDFPLVFWTSGRPAGCLENSIARIRVISKVSTLFSDGFALGIDRVSTPVSTQAADIAQIEVETLLIPFITTLFQLVQLGELCEHRAFY